MLTLKNITKTYSTGDTMVHALNNVSLSFRRNEFVSILGPSGCGKTTLLNIIGGLDRYDSGDLSINGISTHKYRDKDWDSYRNHSVGFVFQSYNLIPHQTVLSNVELALTLSGVSRAERRKRAIEALKEVGLGDQLSKKPNQMSGGQMQRVAIARALVNNPDIVLADEPTGALDSETSVQVMEILKRVAQNRLVIMVTHNPDLATRYSTRIIRLLDGRITDDSNPCPEQEEAQNRKEHVKKPSMNLLTALSLSLNNLLTKKGRTFMISLAGSIGIIGIALILALSTGVQNYINDIESDTMASYPITITAESMDSAGLMTAIKGMQEEKQTERPENTITSSTIMSDIINVMLSGVTSNNLQGFITDMKADPEFMSLISEIRYEYGTTLHLYRMMENDSFLQVNPSRTMDIMTGTNAYSDMTALSSASSMSTFSAYAYNLDVFAQLPDNAQTLKEQYPLLAGRLPEKYDELLLVVDRNEQLSDMVMYTLGLKDPSELAELMQCALRGETFEATTTSYTYDELLGMSFQLVLPGSYYAQDADGIWTNLATGTDGLTSILANSQELKIVGIATMGNDAMTNSLAWGGIGYLPSLEAYAIEQNLNTPAVVAQLDTPDIDIFTGKRFEGSASSDDSDGVMLSPSQKSLFASLSEEQQQALLAIQPVEEPESFSTSTFAQNLNTLNVQNMEEPAGISIYPLDFECKDRIIEKIDAYNLRMSEAGLDENVITYTDYVGLIMSSVTTIVNAITYVLIAFVAISLVVSSIMIGIITYISVLERTKEIGILRAIGASKRDISRVFNAETLIIGFFAGALGVFISWLLTFPITWIVVGLTDIENIAATLPVPAAIVLVVISMILTLIAGLIPSRIAAKKDPVVALRSE